jgi:hypothetical protein
MRQASRTSWPRTASSYSLHLATRAAIHTRVGSWCSLTRYRIDTVFGQLSERFHAKRVWARDTWHLWSRLLRNVLSHTLAVLLNQTSPEPLQLACLLSQ